MADNYIEVTPTDFAEKVLQASELVVVLFALKQSEACQIQESELKAISQKYDGQAKFVRLDVDGQEDLIKQWEVEGIPTLIFFKSGSKKHRITGIVMRDKLRLNIEGVLLAS